MASKYWIKLYHEILHDPKMSRLSAQLWRRAIECFLFAGEYDDGGYLPDLGDMAWIMHTTPEVLETELNELAGLGIVDRRDGRWYVVKFKDRQGPSSDAKRMREWRKRKRKEKEQITDTYRTVTGVTGALQNVTPDNGMIIPPVLMTKEFDKAWKRWCKHLEEKGKDLTLEQVNTILAKLGKLGHGRAIDAITYSIERGWVSIHEPKKRNFNGPPSTNADKAAQKVLSHIHSRGARAELQADEATQQAIKLSGGLSELGRMSDYEVTQAIKANYQEVQPA